MSIQLIVNADDFGLTRGVNEAVLACHAMGSVTSTTLMTNMDAAEHAATLARATPSLGVGLHFNLTAGTPLAGSVSSLTDETGRFLSRSGLLRRALLGELRAAEVRRELGAQLARLKELGLQPTHFDSHQHVHAIPVIFGALADAAATEGVPVRMMWRWPGRVRGKSWRRRLSERVMDVMTRRHSRHVPTGVSTNDGLCSVFDLAIPPQDLTESSYAQLLAPYQKGFIELMVHPALVDAELAQRTEITAVSAKEDRLLRSDFLHRYISSRGGRMATYRELA